MAALYLSKHKRDTEKAFGGQYNRPPSVLRIFSLVVYCLLFINSDTFEKSNKVHGFEQIQSSFALYTYGLPASKQAKPAQV